MGRSLRGCFYLAACVAGIGIFAPSVHAEIAAPLPAARPDVTQQPGGDLFKPELVEMKAHTVAYVESDGKWDDAEDLLNDAFKQIFSALADKSLHATGLPMVEYLDSDDQTFSFRAMVPIDAPPDTDLGEDIAIGDSPAGSVVRVVHEGPFDELEQVYNRIDDYLAAKHLTMDRVIEEYASDQGTTPPNKQVTNIYVFTKPAE